MLDLKTLGLQLPAANGGVIITWVNCVLQVLSAVKISMHKELEKEKIPLLRYLLRIQILFSSWVHGSFSSSFTLISACENLGGALSSKPHKFCCRIGSEAAVEFLREMAGAHLWMRDEELTRGKSPILLIKFNYIYMSICTANSVFFCIFLNVFTWI